MKTEILHQIESLDLAVFQNTSMLHVDYLKYFSLGVHEEIFTDTYKRDFYIGLLESSNDSNLKTLIDIRIKKLTTEIIFGNMKILSNLNSENVAQALEINAKCAVLKYLSSLSIEYKKESLKTFKINTASWQKFETLLLNKNLYNKLKTKVPYKTYISYGMMLTKDQYESLIKEL